MQTLLKLGCEGGSLTVLQQRAADGSSRYLLTRNSMLLLELLAKEAAVNAATNASHDDLASPNQLLDAGILVETATSLAQLQALLLAHRSWWRFELIQLHPDFAAHFLGWVAQHAPASLPRFSATASALLIPTD